MKTSLTLSSLLALFSTMVLLAAVPGVSALAVATQAATFGLPHGLLTALGIVAGDMIFIVIALGGLALLTETMGNLAIFIPYISGVYLIGLGIHLYRSQWSKTRPSRPSPQSQPSEAPASSRLSSFLMGLSITLGDQKATLFYLGFFPAFLDPTSLTVLDAALLIATTVMAVGSIKVGYALLGARARSRISSKVKSAMTAIASTIVITVGIILILTA